MCGKTTVLRDLVRRISTGIEKIEFKGINVGIADERGEIAAMYKGVPQNDVGIRTDVLDNIPKAIGMTMLIRSMAPKVIVADEIGKEEEISAINYAVCSGIKGILFFFFYIRKAEIDKVYTLDRKNLEYMIME